MPIIAMDPNVPLAIPAARPQAQVRLEPAAPVTPTTALVRFQGDIGTALKADALDALTFKVRPVETLEQAASLADRRAQVKLILKQIEDRRKKLVQPLKEEAAAVDAEAHRWSDPLRTWDKDAERVLLAHQRMEADHARLAAEQRERMLTEAATRQAEAEAAGDTEAVEVASRQIMHVEAAAPPTVTTGYKTDAGTTFMRKAWKVEVVDPLLVPPAYLVPDMRKLQAAVDGGARDIEGCNIYQSESLSVRTR